MATPSINTRVRTAVKSPGPEELEALPSLPDQAQRANGDSQSPQTPTTPRRTSFSFLKRGKSVERLNSNKRSSSGAKLTKKQIKERDLQAQREAAMLPKEPPKITTVVTSPPLQTFGGEDLPSRSIAEIASRGIPMGQATSTGYAVPLPPMPGQKGGFVDPYARTESMTNRGRYSYASSTVSTLNSPRRVRRRKDPTPFNVLVIGARNSGKTAFIEFLRTALALPARKQPHRHEDHTPEPPASRSSSNFVSHYLETELSDGERVGLTIWDSEGLEKNVIDLQLREVASFLESKFEDTLNEELKVVRSPGARDTHIHAVFLLLDPLRLDTNLAAFQKAINAQNDGQFVNGKSFVIPPSPANSDVLGSLNEELDLQVLRTLQGKTTVIPVISKADTIPQEHMVELKRSVGESLRQASLDPLENLSLEDNADEEDSSEDDAEQLKRKMHRRHDSKRFDERDEDRLLPSESAVEDDDRSNLSVLDLSSSSSSTSVALGVATTMPITNTIPIAKDATNGPNLFLPLSIISPYPIVEHEPAPGKVGRRFAWGFADPYVPEHCDFVRLKEAVFREWRDELREASRELWYERWRTLRLNDGGERTSRGGPAVGGPARGGPSGRGAPNGARITSATGGMPSAAGPLPQGVLSPGAASGNGRAAQWPLA